VAGKPAKAKPKFALHFDERALAEWHKLDKQIQKQFKKKLNNLITGVEIPSPKARLSGLPPSHFKIKQRSSGYRLVYKYEEDKLLILVIAVGKRNRNVVYDIARGRAGKK
jgi:mRNA interferase RelE/StbE